MVHCWLWTVSLIKIIPIRCRAWLIILIESSRLNSRSSSSGNDTFLPKNVLFSVNRRKPHFINTASPSRLWILLTKTMSPSWPKISCSISGISCEKNWRSDFARDVQVQYAFSIMKFCLHCKIVTDPGQAFEGDVRKGAPKIYSCLNT